MNEQRMIQFLFMLVKHSIYKEMVPIEEYEDEDIDWVRIYEIVQRNKLGALLYDTVRKLPEPYQVPDRVMANWKKFTTVYSFAEGRKYMVLHQILNKAKEQNLTLVLFKGCILANLYPNYLTRLSADTDIFIYQRDKEKVIKLFESMGFYRADSSKESVYNYLLDSIQYEVELHFSLWEDYKSAKIDLLDRMELTKEESLIHIKACGLPITTLGYEEHLIFQIFHIIKHFSLQGVSLSYMTDITLYINRYAEFINLEDFWLKMEQLKYAKFCEIFFNFCIRYLGMSPVILKEREVKELDNEDELILDLLNIGPCYEMRSENWYLMGIIRPYFLGDKEIPKSKLNRKLEILFPPRKYFPIKYAREHPILMPIGCIHRCIQCLIKWSKHRKNLQISKEKMYLSELRLSLMKSMGLTDGGMK